MKYHMVDNFRVEIHTAFESVNQEVVPLASHVNRN